MKHLTPFGISMLLVLLIFGCQKETTPQVLVVGTVTTVDARYISEIPLVNLDVAVFDTEQNPLNGSIVVKEANNDAATPTLAKIKVSNGFGNYKGRMVKSNKPYEYFFSSEGYYDNSWVEAAKIPINSIDENVSLNWSFVFAPIYKKGSVDISVRDYYTGQPLDSDKPVKINISKSSFNDFKLEIKTTPFIFAPYLVLTDGSPWDKYDFYISHLYKGVSCSDNRFDFKTDNWLRREISNIDGSKKITCTFQITSIDNYYYGANGTDFVFFIANKDETGRYFGFKNVSNVIKVEVVT